MPQETSTFSFIVFQAWHDTFITKSRFLNCKRTTFCEIKFAVERSVVVLGLVNDDCGAEQMNGHGHCVKEFQNS